MKDAVYIRQFSNSELICFLSAFAMAFAIGATLANLKPDTGTATDARRFQMQFAESMHEWTNRDARPDHGS